MQFTKSTLAWLVGAAMLAACGSDEDEQPILTGRLLDAEVAGVSWRSSSGLSGVTNAGGEFNFRPGDTVSFQIGGITLGSASGAATLTPKDLLAASSHTDPLVLKLVQLLTTLDQDGNAANGITISAATRSALAGAATFSASADAILADVVGKLAARQLDTSNTALISAEDAEAHYLGSLARAESLQILAGMSVQSLLIGGGGKNCSSWSKSNCLGSGSRAEVWANILAKDPAMAGLSEADIQDPDFDASKVSFSYSVTQAKVDAILANAHLSADAKSRFTTTLNDMLSKGTLAQPGAWPFNVFADGNAFYSNASDNDFFGWRDTLDNGVSFDLTADNVAKLREVAFDNADHKAQIILISDYLSKILQPNSGLSSAQLRDAVKSTKLDAEGKVAIALTDGLNPMDLAILREGLVVPSALSPRRYELRSTAFLANQASRDIYEQFVAAARAVAGKKPKVVVVTASAENPFWDADINSYALKSAGAEVKWLPISGGLRSALDAGKCDEASLRYTSYANTGSYGGIYHQHLVFPDLAKLQSDYCANPASLYAALEEADGIYFSGGDQARHLESLLSRDSEGKLTVASPELQKLRARFAAGKLVVSGTSAGAAVQGGGLSGDKTIPMLGGGDSYNALKHGFAQGTGPTPDDAGTSAIRYAEGGLGFFGHGIVDTHFSIRTREGRLVRLAKDSGVHYGFGLDENTALATSQVKAGKVNMTVLGAGGVYIADVKHASTSANGTGSYAISGVRTHYLTQGDKAVLDVASGELSITLHPAKRAMAIVANAVAPSNDTVFEYGSSSYLTLATALASSGASQALGNTSASAGQASPVYQARLYRSNDTQMVKAGAQVAYSNLMLDIAPQALIQASKKPRTAARLREGGRSSRD